MTKERIKTVLLTVLILCSLVLTSQIWTSEKLWPDGYDFFSVYRLLGNQDKSKVDITVTGAIDSVFAPRTIMLSYTDGRISFNSSQQQGKDVMNVINRIIKKAVVSNDISEISENDWQNALKNKGIYADYSVSIGIDEIGSFLNITDVKKDYIKCFDKIIIDGNSSFSGSLPVYFMDSATNKAVKAIVTSENTTVSNIFNSYSNTPLLNLSYAYELNLDKKLTGVQHQKVLLESYVLLPLDSMKMTEITPVFFDMANEQNIKYILSTLGYNPSSVKRFTQTDNTDIFVDSNATLSVRKDGYIEYTASDKTKGLKISNDTGFSSSAAASAKLLDTLLAGFNISGGTKLFINSPLISDGSNRIVLDFDYLFEANPIYMSGSHACTIEIENGRLTSLKGYLASFDKVSNGQETIPIEVLDKLYQRFEGQEIVINELFCGYYFNTGNMTLKWLARVNNQAELIVIE